jgi:hypothetical protein
MIMIEPAENAAPELPRNRLIAGVIVFVIGHAAPLAIPLVMASSLSTGWKTGLSGLMVFGIPELGTLLTVVVLGKAGFNALKSRILGWIGRSVLPSEVSRSRYYVGLILFLIPFFIGWVSPYLFEVMPNLSEHQLIIAISGDLALIAGLCLMGGQAWDKLRSLFIYNSQVAFPSTATSDPG